MFVEFHDPMTSPATAANVMLHLTILGIAFALINADREPKTTRALAAGMALWGSQNLIFIVLRSLGSWPPSDFWISMSFAPGTLSSILLAEWFWLVLATAPPEDAYVRFGKQLLRFSQILTAVTYALTLVLPDTYIQDYGNEARGEESRAGYWFFESLILLQTITVVLPALILLVRKPDFQEKQRVLAMVVSTLFIASGELLPYGIPNVLATLLGVLVFLTGAIRYHVAQGRRGEFMARFLSPQVRDQVRDRGLLQALQQTQLEISVVCCDLRGFTAYTQAHSSAEVVRLLKNYYDAAGVVVAQFGATIKDFAGDGVLILIGAPIPQTDHAGRAVDLSKKLRDSIRPFLKQHSTNEQTLGLGIGIASGPVMVGVIESSSRMEYAAVGSAVNLAARLCSEALDGEIRISQCTRDLTGDVALEERPLLKLKGFSDPVPNFALTATA